MSDIPTLSKIMVPLDGSALAECGLRAAARLVSPDQGELLLVRVPAYAEMPFSAAHAPYVTDTTIIGEQYEYTRNEAGQYLASAARRLIHAGLRVNTMIIDGDRAEALISCAAAESADLIVMTTHGRTGLTRWIMGSVTERVLQGAPCAVMALRPAPDCSVERPTTRPINRILVALDGSPLAESTLPFALAVASRLDVPVTLFHAYSESGSEQSRMQMESYLDSLLDKWAAAGLTIDRALRPSRGTGASQIASAILEFAESTGTELIALATHGRSGLERRVVGSVMERVLRGTTGGLLVVHPDTGSA